MMESKKLEYKGKEAIKEIEKLTSNAEEVQEQILTNILTQNKDTEYLSKYMLFGSSNDIVSEFKRYVPVITYNHIRPYILRIGNGESSNIITARPVTEMLSRFHTYIYNYLYIFLIFSFSFATTCMHACSSFFHLLI